MNGRTAQEAALGGQSLRTVRRTRSTDSFREAVAELRFTIRTVGALPVAARLTVGVASIVRLSGPPVM
jgi:hypothetical protein